MIILIVKTNFRENVDVLTVRHETTFIRVKVMQFNILSHFIIV